MRSFVLFTVLSLIGLRTLSACGDDPPPDPQGVLLDGGPGGEGGEGGTGCVPRTCESSGVVCGVLDDGCGALVTCDAGCGNAGQGGEGGCVPTTCEAENKNCGMISNGCGAELDCGSCEGASCGAFVANVCGCPPAGEVATSTPRTAGKAESAGFSGTDDEYLELYETSCEVVADCEDACLEQGGTEEMCGASECLESASGGSDCLPAPVWGNLQGIQAESESVDDAAALVVVATAYHDLLLTSDFDLELPDVAVVRGITVEVRRAGDASVSDDAVRIVKGGELGNAERAESAAWSDELGWVTYGGENDLWGEEWTAEDLRAEDFGVALSVNYESTVGNARAYVDQVRVTVHYSFDCEE